MSELNIYIRMTMSDINIKGSFNSPTILFNETEKRLIIEGRSTLEKPAIYYKPVIAKLDDLINVQFDKLEVDFRIEYFNTTSSLVILDVLKHLQVLDTPGNKVIINWYYDQGDDDLLEIGKDYSTMLDFPFNLMVNLNEPAQMSF